MTAPIMPLGATPPRLAGKGSPDALLQTAKQLESIFVRQLYAAMRQTVPTDGVLTAGAAGDTFQQLMDEAIADKTPQQWHHGLAEAITRQFTRQGLVAPDSTARPAAPLQAMK